MALGKGNLAIPSLLLLSVIIIQQIPENSSRHEGKKGRVSFFLFRGGATRGRNRESWFVRSRPGSRPSSSPRSATSTLPLVCVKGTQFPRRFFLPLALASTINIMSLEQRKRIELLTLAGWFRSFSSSVSLISLPVEIVPADSEFQIPSPNKGPATLEYYNIFFWKLREYCHTTLAVMQPQPSGSQFLFPFRKYCRPVICRLYIQLVSERTLPARCVSNHRFPCTFTALKVLRVKMFLLFTFGCQHDFLLPHQSPRTGHTSPFKCH